MLGVLSGLDILPIPAAAILTVVEGLGHSALRQVNLRPSSWGAGWAARLRSSVFTEASGRR